MHQLPPGRTFFTLTELVRAWSEPDADADELALRRRRLREHIILNGCPHTKIGAETVFRNETFDAWLAENEVSL